MNLKNQIILLLLLLIALMSWCVYTYDYNLVLNNKSSNITNLNTQNNISIFNEKNNEKIMNKNLDLLNENDLINNYSDTTKDNIPSIQIDINAEQNLDMNNINDENEIKIETYEINTNEIIKPLITMNKKYIRENNEQRIENLSQETQKLQIKILDILKRTPIIFKSQSNITTQASNATINKIVAILNEYSNIKIEVAGHTDSSGPEALNKQISLKRAIYIQSKLIQLGINQNRVISRGYGESIPLVKNSKDGYSRKNRRVEFNIIQE